MPDPNTIAYTTANVINDAHTAPTASVGVTEWAVRTSPYTVQGWRPISATHQPARMQAKPEGSIAFHPRSNQGESNKRRRRQAHSEVRVSVRMRLPSCGTFTS